MSRIVAHRAVLVVLLLSSSCPALPAWAQEAVTLETVLEHADTHAPLIVAARARLEEGALRAVQPIGS